ncbi:CPBP family intramembrane glutamic endopeptidase [Kribbella sp. CA-293567]|uniref:CPBP family intramembrane glutamic endopeptidase n=1 Tax=Kribbella sp. CA-293567 TaxID=3002436 RepID=UPI0022DE16F1|nr:type II CAAX endopeptidase family protein [Kribbella sp. CA-293567]WBQ06180.1 type II CAAX endopeptidase family protein [Kribbella sp. CA-293567]
MTIEQTATPLTAGQPAEPVSYARLARVVGRHSWWRPILGTFVMLGLALIGGLVIIGVAMIIAEIFDVPLDADDWPVFGEIADTALLLVVTAMALPAVALAARWVQKRRWGSLSSVVGHLRWSWLRTCLAVAAIPTTLLLITSFLIEPEDAPWVGWGTFLTGLAMIICLVPFQAAAEEYVFRGWLLQATGSFLRSPVLVVIPQAILFAAAHGWGTPWGFATLTVFGLSAGWLTIRTGGIEAAVALHVMNNVLAFAAAAAYTGGLSSDETAADLPWSLALLDATLTVLVTVALLHLAKRRKLATHLTPPASAPIPGPTHWPPAAAGHHNFSH